MAANISTGSHATERLEDDVPYSGKESTRVSSLSVNNPAGLDVAGEGDRRSNVPVRWKLISVALICLISFGTAWSARLTSSLKSTVKKELKINNTQFALLEASEEFMATALMMLSGLATDRIGGTGTDSHSRFACC